MMTIKRATVYNEALESLREEHKEVSEELKVLEKLRTREFLLRRAVSTLEYLLEDPDKCRFHLLTKEETEMLIYKRKVK